MDERKTYSDMTLVCKVCGKDFNYSVTEQRFFEEKGFGAPVRCHDCRSAKKARNIEREEKKASKNKPIVYTIDPEEDWFGAVSERWIEQFAIYGNKDN